MTSNKLVSVCMPIYNGATYVHSSVRSILTQTHRDIEFLVVDDGSTDETLEILHSFGDSRMRIIENETNAGNLTRRNQAFDLCQGDFIAIMDADDVCRPDRLERQIAALSRGYELCGSWAANGISPALVTDIWKLPSYGPKLARQALQGSPMPNPSVMMTRHLLDSTGFRFDLDFYPAADYLAWARMILIEEVPTFVVPAPLIFRRQHNVSISRKHKERQDRKADDVRRVMLRHFDVEEEYIDLHNSALARRLSNDEIAKLRVLYEEILPERRPDLFGSGMFNLFHNNTQIQLGAGIAAAGDDRPVVSVVVPAYNIETYVEECVASVLDHNSVAIELILVNDGSTDGTPQICAKLAERYGARLRFIERENGGLSEARNTGLAAARGDYVYYLDGDDLLAPGALDTLVGEAIKQDADVVLSSHAAFFEDDGSTEIRHKVKEYQIYRYNIFDHFAERHFGHPAWNKLIRTSLAKQVSFAPGIYHEDELFCPELFLLAKSVSTLPEVLYYYRQRSGSITASVTEKHIRDWLHVIHNVFDICLAFGLDNRRNSSLARLMDFLLNAARRKLPRMKERDPELETFVHATVSELEARLIQLCGVMDTPYAVSGTTVGSRHLVELRQVDDKLLALSRVAQSRQSTKEIFRGEMLDARRDELKKIDIFLANLATRRNSTGSLWTSFLKQRRTSAGAG